jgi:hypothetical protein
VIHGFVNADAFAGIAGAMSTLPRKPTSSTRRVMSEKCQKLTFATSVAPSQA